MMDFNRFNQLARRAEGAFDSDNPDEIHWMYLYGLYSLVDAVSQISGAMDDNQLVLKQIEGHLHHISLEAFKQ